MCILIVILLYSAFKNSKIQQTKAFQVPQCYNVNTVVMCSQIVDVHIFIKVMFGFTRPFYEYRYNTVTVLIRKQYKR